MEDIVDAGATGDAQTIGDGADALDHLEWPGEPWAKIVAWPKHQRLSRLVKNPEPNPIECFLAYARAWSRWSWTVRNVSQSLRRASTVSVWAAPAV